MVYTLFEGISSDEYIMATYLVGAGVQSDITAKAAALAIEQSTGTWTDVPAETEEVRKTHAAKVIGVYGVPDYELIASIPPETKTRWYVVRLAYPWVNFGSNIPLMLSTVIGNISSMPNLKLLDLEFPHSFVVQFKGPKFGSEGVRKLLGVYDRPLLNNMIKPCTGFPPEIGAKLFYEAAAGGVDWIKDDELIADCPPFSPLEERVREYMAAAKRADEEKGERTLYTVNITDSPDKIIDNAKRAIQAGANGLMINIFASGFSACRVLAEDPEINVPILAHTCFGGAMSSSPASGVSSTLAAKLSRLMGADLYLNVVPSAKFNALKEKFICILQSCTSPFYHIKPSLTMAGGGVTPGMVPYLIQMAGVDFVIGVGGGIHAHPMGPRAGARAMRKAIDATLGGIPLAEAAQEHEELRAALEKWGIYGERDYRELYALEL